MLIERASATIPHVTFDGDMILDSIGIFRRTGSWWGFLPSLTFFEREHDFTTARDSAIAFARKTDTLFIEIDRTALSVKTTDAAFNESLGSTASES